MSTHLRSSISMVLLFFQHMSSLQQALIPEIEERLRKKCENLLITHDLENSTGLYLIRFINEPRRDFQQCGILTSVDSDEPVQPPLKLRNSK